MACHEIGAFDICETESSGFGMVARRDLFQGTVVLRERPIAILRATNLQGAADEVWPRLPEFKKQQWYLERFSHDDLQAPPEVIERYAESEFEKCSVEAQRRWLALADAFVSSEGSLWVASRVLMRSRRWPMAIAISSSTCLAQIIHASPICASRCRRLLTTVVRSRCRC